MTFFDAILLGAVQGITEFLPVSSTGHLIVVGEILGRSIEDGLFFDVMVHLATLLAVVIYFWKDIWRVKLSFWKWLFKKETMPCNDKILVWAVVIGTIPAVVIGLSSEHIIETVFRSSFVVAIGLLAGSTLFALAEKVGKQAGELTIKKGLIIGFFQALALIPGMSRSGSTIAGGLIFGLTREMAAKFSFFLAIPVIAGAGLVKLLSVSSDAINDVGPVIAGTITAFVLGAAMVHFLMRYLRNNSLYVFVWYRVALALLIFLIL